MRMLSKIRPGSLSTLGLNSNLTIITKMNNNRIGFVHLDEDNKSSWRFFSEYSKPGLSCSSSSNGLEIKNYISTLLLNTQQDVRQHNFQSAKQNLIQICTLLNQDENIKLSEKTWNDLIYNLAKYEGFEKQALIVMNKALNQVKLNSYSLHLVMKIVSKEGNLKDCGKIMNILKSQNMMTIYTFINMINCYLFHKNVDQAIAILEEIPKFGIKSDDRLYMEVLKVCNEMKLYENGKKVIYLANLNRNVDILFEIMMLNFYTKSKDYDTAIKLGNSLIGKSNSIIVWNCLIKSYSCTGDINMAFDIYSKMQKFSLPDDTTFSILFKLCSNFKLHKKGKLLHDHLKSLHLNISPKLQISILNFYIKCGEEFAIEECQEMKRKGEMNVVSYSCLIQAFANRNEIDKVFETVAEMKMNGILPNVVTFTILFSICSKFKLLEKGKEIERSMVTNGVSDELLNAILSFYYRCEDYESVIRWCEIVKNNYGDSSVNIFNFWIPACISLGQLDRSFELLEEMKVKNIDPDEITMKMLFKTCADRQLLENGRKLVEFMKGRQKSQDLKISIINFHIKCCELDLAIEECENMRRKGEMNTVSYSCLIQAYVKKNDIEKAFEIFKEMQENDIEPDDITFIIMLQICAENQLLEKGKQILLTLKGKEKSKELQVSIINFYIKCGEESVAIEECEQMKRKGEMNVVSYSCLIQAFANLHETEKAFEILNEMKLNNIQPDEITYIILLSMCGKTSCSTKGKELLEEIKNRNMFTELVQSITILFYSHIGEIDESSKIFNSLIQSCNIQSIEVYNNMLNCYTKYGMAKEAIEVFNIMKERNIEPNDETFTCLISVFAHSGMIQQAETLMEIKTIYGRSPSEQNITALIDVYSRAGLFDKAISLITGNCFIQWSTVMAGCKKFNNLELAEQVFTKLIEIDSSQASPYTQLYNIYTFHHEFERANEIQLRMEEGGVKKIPGLCYFEHDSKLYKFTSGSIDLRQQFEIEQELNRILNEISKYGYIPNTKLVSRSDLKSESDKINSLHRHAEKLAIAFAFLMDPNRRRIVLSNNLRICNDCRLTLVMISKVRRCEIVISDPNRVHHFKDGKCSCKN